MRKPQVTKIETDLRNLCIHFRAKKKFGKSTTFRDVVIKEYGSPECGLLVQCGAEHANTLLDDLNTVHCETWKDFQDLLIWLTTEEWVERDDEGKEIARTKVPHNIKLVGFEATSEFVKVCEKQAIAASNRENPNKPKVKSIMAAYGGYQRGFKRAAEDWLLPYFNKLKNAGFGLWLISHTDYKTIKDKAIASEEEGGWKQLTSNLYKDYENAISQNLANCVLTGNLDVETEEVGKGDKKTRRLKGEVRKLYFRSTPLVEAGCGFAPGSVPEYLVYDKPNMAEDLIRILKQGMELSKSGIKPEDMPYPVNPVEEVSDNSSDDFDDDDDDLFESETNSKPEEKKEIEADLFDDDDDDLFSEETEEDYSEPKKEYPENLGNAVNALFKKCTDKELRSKVFGEINKYKRVSNCPQSKLEELYDLLTA